ncbi:hypothetical protein D3C84_901130 [compost metagenome]
MDDILHAYKVIEVIFDVFRVSLLHLVRKTIALKGNDDREHYDEDEDHRNDRHQCIAGTLGRLLRNLTNRVIRDAQHLTYTGKGAGYPIVDIRL